MLVVERLDSVEQPLDLDDGEVFDWPWLYGVEVGHWDLSDAQAKAMREYLLRGGFFMCDDFHGAIEWDVFRASRMVRRNRRASTKLVFPVPLRPMSTVTGSRLNATLLRLLKFSILTCLSMVNSA